MQVRFCQDTYRMDSPEFGRLRDSADAVNDVEELRLRLAKDGYLFIRGLLDRNEVLHARRTILAYMDDHAGLEPGARPLDGVMGSRGKAVPMMGQKPVTHHADVRSVLESKRLYDFYNALFAEPTLTFSYKWLRAVGNEEATGCHMDHVYMGRGSQRLMTCWIPFGDIPITQGTLAVCEGSHADPAFERLRNTYGKMDVDRDLIADGWFSKRPREITENFGARWLTDDVRAGDVITFGMHMMHASTTNTTNLWRLSCDVRFQPEADPVDERWVGETPISHSKSQKPDQKLEPMEVARERWGV